MVFWSEMPMSGRSWHSASRSPRRSSQRLNSSKCLITAEQAQKCHDRESIAAKAFSQGLIGTKRRRRLTEGPTPKGLLNAGTGAC